MEKRKLQINKLSSHLKNHKKGRAKQTQNKQKGENNKDKTQNQRDWNFFKNVEKIISLKRLGSLKNINKTDKPLERLTNKKDRNYQDQ